MEWVVIPFSKVSSWSGGQSQIFCNAGEVFIIWTIAEAQIYAYIQAHMYVVSVSKCFRILYFLFLFRYRWFGNTIFFIILVSLEKEENYIKKDKREWKRGRERAIKRGKRKISNLHNQKKKKHKHKNLVLKWVKDHNTEKF